MRMGFKTCAQVSAAACLLLVGCNRGKRHKKAVSEASAATTEILALLPQDTALVFAMAPKVLVTSPLFAGQKRAISAGIGPVFAEFKETCDIDLLSDIYSGVFAVGNDDEDVILGVRGAFDRKKVEACITAMGGAVQDDVYQPMGEGFDVYFHWPDANTVVISTAQHDFSAEATAERFTNNSEMMSLVSKVDLGGAFWTVGSGEIASEFWLEDEMQSVPPGFTLPKTGYLGLVIESGISATGALYFASEDEATSAGQLVEVARTALRSMPGGGGLSKALTSTTSGTQLKLDFSLSNQDLQELGPALMPLMEDL